MKSHCRMAVAVQTLSVLGACFIGEAATRATSEFNTEWPRVITRDGVTNTIYQPQLQSWDYSTLRAICVVAIQPTGAKQPTLGTIQVAAKTHVDRAARTVLLHNIEIVQGTFPFASDEATAYLAALRSFIPNELGSISLDRVEASLAVLEARRKAASQPLKNDPPSILFSTTPAILVLVDGPPIYRPIGNVGVERVFNTRALILRDSSGRHFFHLFDGYMQATSLGGPWRRAEELGPEIQEAETLAIAEKQVDLMAGQENPETQQKPSLTNTPIPAIYVRSEPTELIVIHGEPQWTPLQPTQLMYISNTVAHVFRWGSDPKTFILVSGRWFAGNSLEGPWAFVSGRALPKDFYSIPNNSPKENVKAAIPGTRQAMEAVIANGIPDTIQVDRKKVVMDPAPQYDGGPDLEPITGTPLSLVRNCHTPVLTKETNAWYACQNRVWFSASSSEGPWAVATAVPADVYSIPPSSPVHYVVYSRIYRFDDNYVWIGTTPGYYGTLVGSDGTVVFGTGYAYPPSTNTGVYVSYPLTYGYGSSPCWTPWLGWAYGFAAGWEVAEDWYWWCACPPAPYWGPYWYPCYHYHYNPYGGITAWGPYGWAGTTGYIYHEAGPWAGVSRGAAGYNAWTGNEWATRYGKAYNSTTGTRVVGQRGAVENVYSGSYAYGGRGAFYNEQTGAAGAARKVTWGNEDTGKQGTAGRSTVYSPKTDEIIRISGAKGESGGFIRVNDQVVVGKDGNYYRPDGEGGWDQIPKPLTGTDARGTEGSVPRLDSRSPERWSKVQPSQINQQHLQELNAEIHARQVGAQRQQSFQNVHAPPSPPPKPMPAGGGRRR